MALVPRLGGAERDTAQVKIGVAQYSAKETKAAQKYLADLAVDSPHADAERLYYLLLCARRANDRDSMTAVLGPTRQLASRFHLAPGSAARRGQFLSGRKPSGRLRAALPSLLRIFPRRKPAPPAATGKSPGPTTCAAKTTPAICCASTCACSPTPMILPPRCISWRRLAEGADDPAAARAYYNEIVREYPNYFYTGLARERLAALPATATAPSAPVNDFLRTVEFQHPRARAQFRTKRHRQASPGTRPPVSLRPDSTIGPKSNSATPRRMKISRTSWAWNSPPWPTAVGAARSSHPLFETLRARLFVSAHRFRAPTNSGSWRSRCPIATIFERFARQNNLDPFLLAALARQESEFNPKAVSVSSARGLTQIMPSTGREFSRQLAHQAVFDRATVPAASEFAVGIVLFEDRSPTAWKAAGKPRSPPTTPDSAGRKPGPLGANSAKPPSSSRPCPSRKPANTSRSSCATPTSIASCTPRPATADCQKPAAPASRVSYSDGIDQRRKSSRATGAR